MLQQVGRAATPKLVPRNCPRCLQTTMTMGGGGLVSDFMWGIAATQNKTFDNLARKLKKFSN